MTQAIRDLRRPRHLILHEEAVPAVAALGPWRNGRTQAHIASVIVAGRGERTAIGRAEEGFDANIHRRRVDGGQRERERLRATRMKLSVGHVPAVKLTEL